MAWEFNFTAEHLAACVPHNKDPEALYQALDQILPKYEITNLDRVAAFLAQCGHESADFTVLHENLNYRAEALIALFKSHFPGGLAEAQHYASQPNKQEVIANRIYCNRMGNGDEASGDGYLFRGRGAIQLTGRTNYTRFAQAVGMSVEDAVAYCDTLEGAVESACWFWSIHRLNDLADQRNMTAMTKVINGGTLGLDDRKARMAHNLSILES
jgi:putative chitinase